MSAACSDHALIEKESNVLLVPGTDIPCCLLFVLALIALVAMLVYGAMYGNARKLNYGFDGRGPETQRLVAIPTFCRFSLSARRQCGVHPDVIERSTVQDIKPSVLKTRKGWVGQAAAFLLSCGCILRGS